MPPKVALKKSSRKSITRRTFVKTLPAAGAAAVVAAKTPLTALAQTPTPSAQASPSPSPQPRIKKDDLDHAEKIIGIDFNDKQEEMAPPGVNRLLDSYEAVRKIDVPLDTEPAVVFHPELPGFHVKRAKIKTKFHFGRNEPAQYKSVEDLAFATVPQLAELIRLRKVSSVDLTKMYLSRLKKYGPKLLCVVTLTEDLAMKQAQDADNDLKRGKYRGPLHGIPCSGPRYLPRFRSLSASCACFIARSSVSVTTHKSFGPYFFKRDRYILVRSTDDTLRSRINSASCGTVANARSSTDLYCAGSFLPK